MYKRQALTTIVLYLAAFLPISTLALLTIASAIITICIIRSDVQTSIFVYIASSLIAFFLVPINISLLYFIFFGVFGIIKFFIERLRKEKLEILLKDVYKRQVLQRLIQLKIKMIRLFIFQ